MSIQGYYNPEIVIVFTLSFFYSVAFPLLTLNSRVVVPVYSCTRTAAARTGAGRTGIWCTCSASRLPGWQDSRSGGRMCSVCVRCLPESATNRVCLLTRHCRPTTPWKPVSNWCTPPDDDNNGNRLTSLSKLFYFWFIRKHFFFSFLLRYNFYRLTSNAVSYVKYDKFENRNSKRLNPIPIVLFPARPIRPYTTI